MKKIQLAPVLIFSIFLLIGHDGPMENHATGVMPASKRARAINIELVQVASGFARPVNVDYSPDGTGRLFVVEQNVGRIRIVDNGSVLSTPFLDVDNLVKDSGNEQGLLDIAFHPDYAQNGFFFINYTALDGNGDTVVARYKVSDADPNIADPSSAKLIIQINQPYGNHNGGEIKFGPDGYLYIGMGDGGSGGDPQGHGQNLNSLLGKMLRLDVDVDDLTPYAIPDDNPFKDTGFLEEIWAYGLRNPWQFSFDSRTGDMYIADVGQNAWEEVDFQPADSDGGENYGWNIMEGAHCYSSPGCDETGLVLPVAEYAHNLGCSVTGIGSYRGSDYPALDGIYFFGEYCTGRIWGLQNLGNGNWAYPIEMDTPYSISGGGKDADGNVFFTAFSAGGSLWKIVGG